MLAWYEVCATMSVLGSFMVRLGMCVQAQGSRSLGVTSDSATGEGEPHWTGEFLWLWGSKKLATLQHHPSSMFSLLC